MSNVDKETGEILPEMSDADYLAELGLDPIPPGAGSSDEELSQRLDQAFELIGELAEKVGGGEGKKKARFYNWRYQESETTRLKLWAELRSFVDWLNAEYFLHESNQAIPGCWYRHSDAVHILTAIWAAWVPAYFSAKTFPSNEAAIWHRDTLYPLLEKLEQSFSQCRNERKHYYQRSALLTVTDDGFDDFISEASAVPAAHEMGELVTGLAAGNKIE